MFSASVASARKMLCGTCAIVFCHARMRFTDDGLAVDQHFAFSGDQQAHQQIESRAFAAAGATDQIRPGALANRKIEVVEHPRTISPVTEPHIAEADSQEGDRARHRAEKLGSDRLIEQLQNLLIRDASQPRMLAQALKRLLQQREHALRAQRQRTEGRQRLATPPDRRLTPYASAAINTMPIASMTNLGLPATKATSLCASRKLRSALR